MTAALTGFHETIVAAAAVAILGVFGAVPLHVPRPAVPDAVPRTAAPDPAEVLP